MLPEQRMLRFNASGGGGYVSTLFLIHSIAVTILCHIIFNNTTNTFYLLLNLYRIHILFPMGMGYYFNEAS